MIVAPTEAALRREMVALGRSLYAGGLIVAGEGNFSVRLDERRLLVTPSGLCKGELSESDLVMIDVEGRLRSGRRGPSSEVLLHLEVYRRRPDVQAVVHAHPPHCIALMLAGKGLDLPLLAENVILLGKVPTADFALPGTGAVPDSIRPWIEGTNCILLDRHGSLSVGESLREARFLLETMEQTAKTYLLALRAGNVAPLPMAMVRELERLRREAYGLTAPVIPF